ncbi:unnamed protein product, partial [Anisakis simplex]|uniref:DUF1540 domain-containing protein n=1 Tax=Anisakis simplex TaxID=6269 RepID=A0A0M3JQL6_ANISI
TYRIASEKDALSERTCAPFVECDGDASPCCHDEDRCRVSVSQAELDLDAGSSATGHDITVGRAFIDECKDSFCSRTNEMKTLSKLFCDIEYDSMDSDDPYSCTASLHILNSSFSAT